MENDGQDQGMREEKGYIFLRARWQDVPKHPRAEETHRAVRLAIRPIGVGHHVAQHDQRVLSKTC